MAERRLTRIDKINVDEIAKDAASKIKAQKVIDRANALNDEIIARKEIEFILDNYKGVEQEGLLALLVGSNEIRAGARNSVANLQDTVQANLINSFKQKLRKAGLEKLFTDADLPTQKRIAQVMEEAGAQQTDIEKRAGIKPPITETNADIKKITNIGKRGITYHNSFCAKTMSFKFSDPTHNNTLIIIIPIETS